MSRLLSLLLLALLSGWSAQSAAVPAQGMHRLGMAVGFPAAPTGRLLLAEGDGNGGGGDAQQQQAPAPGTLVIPGSPQGNTPEKDQDKKKCMTVCARWGQECVLVNQGAGGMQRRCRPTCQQTTEECF